jgi:hypothetical protein
MKSFPAIRLKLAECGLTPQKILKRVDDFIDTKKFRQGFGTMRSTYYGLARLGAGVFSGPQLRAEDCRCYVGLIAEVLVEEGLYRWKNIGSIYDCRITEKGRAALGYEAPEQMNGDTTEWLGIPCRITARGGRSLVTLNDNYKYSFEGIQNLVKEQVALRDGFHS